MSATAIGAEVNSCDLVRTVAIDTSEANSFIANFRGEGIGQTFVAPVRSVTVWRSALQTPNFSPMKLWITEVDSSGKPLVQNVVFDGPIMVVGLGDGVHPIEIRYDLDPPVHLPRVGKYAFFVQQLCTGFFDLYRADHDVYSDGHAWRTARSPFYECILVPDPSSAHESDLTFSMEFCDFDSPLLRKESWGRLKIIYR